jgi:DNA-binding PadR family transcriptional regulator
MTMLEPLELSILAAIRRLTRNSEFTGGLEVGKDLDAVGVGIEDQRLYRLLMNLKEDGYIRAALALSTSSNAFKLLQLTTSGRESCEDGGRSV